MKYRIGPFVVRLVVSLAMLTASGSVTACSEDEPAVDIYVAVTTDGPNSLFDVRLTNYLGNTENIHPKVLYFENGWNGYEYWMAYTPYPSGSTVDENPCIAASHDGYVWIEPEGLVNPLAMPPESGYNSDTHLVYNPDNDMLECWWRPCDLSSGRLRDAFVRRLSSDGVNWGEEEMVLGWGDEGACRLSPCVSIVDGRYYMVYSDCVRLHYMWGDADPDGGIVWEPQQRMYIPDPDVRLNMWHHDMIIDEDRNVDMVICAFAPAEGGTNNSADLYHIRYNLDEPQCFTVPEKILARGVNMQDIDYRSIYRSSIVKVADEYRIYYSSIDLQWKRHMSVSSGSDLQHLRGLSHIKPAGSSDARLQAVRFTYVDPEAEVRVYDSDGNLVAAGIGSVLVEGEPDGVYVIRAGGRGAIFRFGNALRPGGGSGEEPEPGDDGGESSEDDGNDTDTTDE